MFLFVKHEHEVVDIAPSVDVIVVVPQASVAVAVPSAALISEAEGLQPRVTVVSGCSKCWWQFRSLVHVTVLDSSSRVTTTIRSSECSCL